MKIRTVSSNVAYIEQNDSVMKCNCIARSTAVYLNSSRDYQEEATIIKVDDSANVVTIYPHGSETIDGAASVTLSRENDSKTLVPVDGGWAASTDNTDISSQLADTSINVKNFGATGDGTTDDTNAFERAIIAAGIGGKVFVPKGNYITNRLYLLDSQSFFGVGAGSKLKLKAQHIASPGGFGGVLNATGTISENIKNVHIFDIYVDGNSAGITTPVPGTDDIDIECINLKYAENCIVNNVFVINAVDSGVDFDNSINCSVTGVRAEDCGGYAVHLSTASENITVSDSFAVSCGFAHLRGGFDTYTGVKNCKYVNCHTTSCNIGFNIKGDDNQLVNCSDSAATANAMRLEGVKNKVVNFAAKNSANNSISIPSSYNNLLNVSVDGANACFYVEGNNNKLTNCTAKASVDGFKLIGPSNVLISCLSVDATRYGYELTGAYNGLTSCTCDNAATNALRITAASQRIVNFDARNTGSTDTAIYVNSVKNVFIGGSSRDNGKSGMWIDVVADNIVQGMSFIGNDTYGLVLFGSNVKVLGCIFEGNTSGAVNNTGSGNKYLMNLGLADN